jgi:hypothetical protein
LDWTYAGSDAVICFYRYGVQFHVNFVHFDGVAAATPSNQLQRCILTDYFKNYNFSRAQIIRSLMMVIEPKNVGAVLM